MKNFSTFLCILILSVTVSAQTPFWIEDFGTGCNQGQLAAGVTTSKGTWTVTQTGQNDDEANGWYISGKQAGAAPGACASHSCTTSNRSLHVAAVGTALGNVTDDGATYNSGGLCGNSIISICVTAHARAESPTINCTGQSNITLSFLYIEGGDDVIDNATCWYYNGTAWTLLEDMPKTVGSCANGQWTAHSIPLPPDANGNPNVKIGFNWENDDDGGGNDPSFAVDSIKLTVPGIVGNPPVAKIAYADSVVCQNSCISSFHDASTNSPTSWLWTFAGGFPPTSTVQNPPSVCYATTGNFSVTLQATNSAGSNTVTLTNKIQVIAAPVAPTISRSGGDSLCSTTDASYTSYSWFYNGGTTSIGNTPCIKINNGSGDYSVHVKNSNNCESATQITVGIQNYSFDNTVSIYPSPATNELTVTGEWKSDHGTLSVYDVLGKRIKEYSVRLDGKVIVDVKSLPEGVYFLQINNDKGRWTGRFVKE